MFLAEVFMGRAAASAAVPPTGTTVSSDSLAGLLLMPLLLTLGSGVASSGGAPDAGPLGSPSGTLAVSGEASVEGSGGA